MVNVRPERDQVSRIGATLFVDDAGKPHHQGGGQGTGEHAHGTSIEFCEDRIPGT